MIIYKNKWCKVESKDTFYILKSLKNKYNDRYFLTLPDLCNNAGLNYREVLKYNKGGN